MQNRKGSWRIACATLALVACLANDAFAQNLNFELIAGGAEGNGGPAMQANLPNTGDLAYDAQGNLYVVLFNNNRIRKITPTGTITTVVGGITGFGGDGGQASAAKIDRPDGIAFDAAGNLYFSDTGNRRIRKVTAAGVISTYAGNGGRTSAGDGGQAINASFASVGRISFDGAGNLFVAEASGNRIRKITAAGVISTFAGTGVAGYTGDSGAATSATLNFPMGVVAGNDGYVYIADTNNNAVRRVASNGTITTSFVFDFSFPNEVTIDGSDLYVGDTGNCVIYVAGTGASPYAPVPAVGSPMDGCTTTIEGQSHTQSIGIPDGIAFDPSGLLVYGDWDTGQVRRRNVDGSLHVIAGSSGGYTDGRNAIGAPMGFLAGIAVDEAGNVLVTDVGYRRVHRVSTAGLIWAPMGTGNANTSGVFDCDVPCYGKDFSLTYPWGITAGDAAGEILFTDRILDRVYRVDASGYVTTWAGSFAGTYGGEGDAKGNRIDAWGLARDPAGALIVANARAQRMQRIAGGMVTNIAGNGTAGATGDGGAALAATLNGPMAVATDSVGNVYFSENAGLRVRKFTPGGNITAFAGTGTAGASGDGGAATAASVGRVFGIAVHGSNTYISSDGQLRVIGADGIIRSVAGWTHFATGLFVRGDMLYLATAEGHVYRAALPPPPRAVEHDYDGDGRSDILWRNTTNGANTIWKAANGATLQTVTGVTSQSWKILGQGDFDGDGRDDIFWRNVQNGANTVWRSANGATVLATTGVTDLGWTVVGVGDFNKDGKADLVWRHKGNGTNAIWRTLAGAGIAVAKVPDQNWQIVGVGDFDGDGQADLFWRNAVTGANQVWRGGSNLSQLAVSSAAVAWKVQAVGDFDGDGRSDVFWRNANTGQNVIWNRANAATSRTLTTITDLKWNVAAAGDYNGDGKDDLLWRHGTSGANTIWKSANGATVQTVTGVTSLAWTIVPYTNQP